MIKNDKECPPPPQASFILALSPLLLPFLLLLFLLLLLLLILLLTTSSSSSTANNTVSTTIDFTTTTASYSHDSGIFQGGCLCYVEPAPQPARKLWRLTSSIIRPINRLGGWSQEPTPNLRQHIRDVGLRTQTESRFTVKRPGILSRLVVLPQNTRDHIAGLARKESLT